MYYDIIIIGGGPAGSTTATLTKRYAPHLRILLLEKAHFPRHHVGESLLAGASPVLQEMEAYDKVNNADSSKSLARLISGVRTATRGALNLIMSSHVSWRKVKHCQSCLPKHGR